MLRLQFYSNTIVQPCILPRLLACYTLYKDYQQDHQQHQSDLVVPVLKSAKKKVATRRRKRSLDSKTAAIESIQPVRGFLQSLVDLEYGTMIQQQKQEQPQAPSSADHRQRKVHFASFDGSSLCPPSDVTEGSYKPQQVCIQHLDSILSSIQQMKNNDESTWTVVLQDIVQYLDHDFRLYYHDKVCAQSISVNNNAGGGGSTTTTKNSIISTTLASSSTYPTRRIEKAAAVYSRDLESLIEQHNHQQRQEQQQQQQQEPSQTLSILPSLSLSTDDDYHHETTTPLTWECRLADVAAQLVRYWLRTILNPVPCRANQQTKTQRWNSRISELVELTDGDSIGFYALEGGESTGTEESSSSLSTAVEDGALSSLLSDSLSHLYDYLGGIDLSSASSSSWKEQLIKVLPDESCCASEICHRGLGTGRKPASQLSDEEWQQVGHELQTVCDFCAFYHRVIFLEQLLTIIIESSNNWLDHWKDTVETTAKHLVNLSSSSSSTVVVQEEDVHLVLLGIPLTELLRHIQEDIIPIASSRYELCKFNLQTTINAFRLGKPNTKHKKLYQPQIGELEDYWKQYLQPGTVFPSVKVKTTE